MANKLIAGMKEMVPYRWRRFLRTLLGQNQRAHYPSLEQNNTISNGLGKGLKFNPGLSNPDYASGNNELPVQQVLQNHLQAGDVFFDIGANVGFFTIIAAHLIGPAGHVYAFEPLPDNINIVRHNIELNQFSNVHLIEAAVADRPGVGELLVAHYSGGSALSVVDTPPPDMKERMSVELVSIDDLLANGVISVPKLIKIDVEGAEITVLKGMVDTLGHHRPIIIYEIDDADAHAFEQKARACVEFLHQFGYQVTALAESYTNIDWHVGHYLAS